MVVNESVLNLAADRVVAVEMLDPSMVPSELKAVRVHYRDDDAGEAVMAVSDVAGARSFGRLPFAIVSRARRPARVMHSPRYEALERAFLEHNDLTATLGTLPSGRR